MVQGGNSNNPYQVEYRVFLQYEFVSFYNRMYFNESWRNKIYMLDFEYGSLAQKVAQILRRCVAGNGRWDGGPNNCGIWEVGLKQVGDGREVRKTGRIWEVGTSTTPISLSRPISNTPYTSIHRDVVKLHFFVTILHF